MGSRLAGSVALMVIASLLEAAGVVTLVLLVGTLGVDVSTGGAGPFGNG